MRYEHLGSNPAAEVIMASVIRYPRSKYWFAAFRDSRGRQHRRTTRETDKRRAQTVADQFERIAQRKGSPQRVRQIFAEFYREHYAEELRVATTRHYLEKWLASRKSELAPATYRRYQKTIEKLIKFLATDADRDLGEISKAQITEFRNTQAEKSSQANANTDLKVLKVAFRAARLDGYIWEDPAEGVKTFRLGDSRDIRRPFTIPEIQKVLEVADSEWKSLIKFGLYTGQRLADIALLRWEQIDLDRDEITLVVRKTKKKMTVPLAGPLREHLLILSAPDKPSAPVHPQAYRIVTSQNGRVGTLSNAFADLLAQAGLRAPRTSEGTGKGRGNTRRGIDISFHSLRHTSVSLLKDAGIPDAVVMAMIGHSSASMSHRYTHVGKEALSKAAATLPQL
jgi:integrase